MLKNRILALFMAVVLSLTLLSMPAYAKHNYSVILSTIEESIESTAQFMDVVITSFASGCGDEEFMTMAAIDEDNNLWMWGDNSYSKCLSIAEKVNSPTQVMQDILQVAIGENHVAVIKTDNTLWTWGRNHEGQLGTGTVEDVTIPQKIMSNVTKVVAGPDYTMAIDNSGRLYGFGLNRDGQFSFGYYEGKGNDKSGSAGYSTYRLTKPTLIAVDVIDVSAADCWSMAITSDGKLYGAGRNTNGQLGTGDYNAATSLGGYLDRNEAHPVIPNLQGEIPVKVSTGDNYTMVVTQDGGLWGFGKSFYGQLGENTQTGIGLAGTNVPVKIMDCVKDVFCGDTCSIILTVDDKLVQLGGPDKGFINNTAAGNVQLKTGISQINNTGLPMTLDTNGSLYLIKNKVFTPIEIKIPYEATTEIRYVFQGGSVITVYVGGDKEINGGIFLIAFYKNDVLQDVLKQPVNKLGDAITFNPPPDSDKCRIFLFKDFETIKPLAEDKGFELASSTNIIATATEEKVSGYKTTYNVTVEMGLESQNFANTPVTLTVVPDNAKDEYDLLDAAYIYQGFLDDDASVTITFPIHCDYAGLKVCANTGGIYLGEAHIIEQ